MQARFINKILTQLWPFLSVALHKEVVKQSELPIKEALEKIPMVKNLRIDNLDLGSRPFRVDSFKTYDVFDDQIVFEAPVFWGGDISIRVTAVVEMGGKRIDFPVEVNNIQLKALARITLNPLVEQLPCFGGVNVSLLEDPIIGCDFRLLDSPDILSIPPIPLALKVAIKIILGKLLRYPNEYSLPILENYGLPPPPKGILRIKVVSGHKLKSTFFDKVDPYVELEVRKGKSVATTVKQDDENPIWDETLDLVVDNFDKQSLKVVAYDDDLISSDLVGGVNIDFHTADFIHNPGETDSILVPIYHPRIKGVYHTLSEEDYKACKESAQVESKVREEVEKMPQRKGLIPYLRRKRAAKKVRKEAMSSPRVEGSLPSTTSEATMSVVDASNPAVRKKEAGSVTGGILLHVQYIPFDIPHDISRGDSNSLLKRKVSFHSALSCFQDRSLESNSPWFNGLFQQHHPYQLPIFFLSVYRS